MKKYILPLMLLGLTLPLSAQFTQKVRVGNTQDAGITYCLPKAALSITVDAQCTTLKAGPYAQFAEKYLGINDAPQEDAVVWQVTAINVLPYAVPDTSKVYHVTTTAAAQVPAIHLSEEGMLWTINCEPEVSADASATEAEEATQEPKKVLSSISVMNEEILKAGSKSKQAELIARQIFRLRESRQNLLVGDVDNYPADGASFQLVLDNLEAQEKAYMALFTGTKSVTTDQRTYTCEPGAAADILLFRFSRHYGFVDADDLVGEPYNLKIEVLEDNTEVPVLRDAKGRVRPESTGIAYNIPGKAKYSISHGSDVLAHGQVAVAQLGHVERLSPTQFTDKKKPAKAVFDLFTGNIRIYE